MDHAVEASAQRVRDHVRRPPTADRRPPRPTDEDRRKHRLRDSPGHRPRRRAQRLASPARHRPPGPVFTSAYQGRTGARAITGSGLTNMLKQRAAAAGMPPKRITGRSLRAMHATTVRMAGVALDRIAAQTRH